jgi:ABC-type nickel/cobalt efflux system permease component RcnA
MIAALTGAIAGAVHVWSGPDHLAAIAPLAVRRPVRAWLQGATWGLGHSAGVTVVGLVTLWLRDLIPVDLVSTWGERLVGVMLLGIGLWALRKALRIHAHEHEHDGETHMHLHAHAHSLPHEHSLAHQHHTHAAFGIGLLHGLAGTSHFLGVLASLAFPTRLQAISYLIAFAVGTIVSMAIFSWAMGAVATRYARSSAWIYRWVLGLCATSAMLVGCFWLMH